MKIVILTCDEYAWIVPFCLYFYKKYWPDNPYQTEIITESNHMDGSVYYTEGASWSSGILSYIKQSKENKFILIQEDFLIESPVDTTKIRKAELLCKGDVGCVRLTNTPHRYFQRHSVDSDISGFREYPLSGRFAMTTQMGICQKSFLFDALRENETAWETEKNGSERLARLTHKWKIIWPENRIVNYHDGGLMRKGALRPEVLKWMKPELLADNSTESKLLHELIQDKIISMRDKET